MQSNPELSGTGRDGRLVLRLALVLGLLLRLAILWQTTSLGTTIVDEQHYTALARNVAAGHGFAFDPGQPTSIRPPLYPGFLAAVWRVAGIAPPNLQTVRLLQIAMALGTAWLVFALGRRVFGAPVGRYAAAIVWLYPSLVFFNSLILTETLFTFLLVAFVLSAVTLIQTPRAWTAVLCGLSLGLAALTRSVLWPLPLVLCPLLALLLWRHKAWGIRVGLPALVLVGYAVVVTPWAIRNTKLQHVVTIVDTMGGMNMRMGNYEYTPEDRMWDAVALTGDKNWSYALRQEEPTGTFTEGYKEKWAQRKAVAYMIANPGVTARRSLIKFSDLWGLEREFIAGVQSGQFRPPVWFAVIASVAIVLAYVALVLTAASGLWLAAPAWREHCLLLLPVVAITAVHTLVFGHSRYHVPLVPILALYAAAVLSAGSHAWRTHSVAARVGAAGTMLVLVSIWVRQIAVTDADRIRAFLSHVV